MPGGICDFIYYSTFPRRLQLEKIMIGFWAACLCIYQFIPKIRKFLGFYRYFSTETAKEIRSFLQNPADKNLPVARLNEIDYNVSVK